MADCVWLNQVSANAAVSHFMDSVNGLFWDTAYDLWGLKKKERVDFYHHKVVVMYTHFQTHIYVQTTSKSEFCIIGAL